MKIISKRIITFILCSCLFTASCLSHPITVQASIVDDIKTGWDKFDKWATEHGLKFVNIIPFACSQYGALVDADFSKWMANQDAFFSYWNEDHVTLQDDGSIAFDKEFMEWLKNLLEDYANQTQTFYYAWSTGFNDIPVTYFGEMSVVYNSVKNVVSTAPGNTIKLCMWPGTSGGISYVNVYISAYDSLPDVGFVKLTSGGGWDLYTNYSMSTWEVLQPDIYCKRLTTGDAVIQSWDEFRETADRVNLQYSGTSFTNKDRLQQAAVLCGETQKYTSSISEGIDHGRLELVSLKRNTFRVFRKSADLFDYSLGKRSVYFTSGFWDYEPEDFTATFDELNDSIGRLDDILQQLLDKIGDGTDESTIEELLQQILDELRNGGGSGGGGGDYGSGSGGFDFGDLFDFLAGYFEAILDYLDGILQGIEALVWFQWDDDRDDGEILDIMDIWELIKENPETGSQEAADSLATSFSDVVSGLSRKFPFSIPWDVYALFTVFSEVDTPQKADINVLSSPAVRSVNGYADGVRTMSVDAAAVESDEHDAPYFRLPITIERYGIDADIIVDLSPFQPVSTLSRTLFSVLFALALLKFTIKMMSVLRFFEGGD